MSAENRRITALLIWGAYFIVPSDSGGLVGGWPLGPIEAAALLAVGWLALYGGRPRYAGIAAAAMIVSFAAGSAIPGSPGMRARYFANAEATGNPERSTEYTTSPFTRIDQRLHFAPGGPELPLNFFNDNTRYSLFQVAYIRHDQLPFAARWAGEWWLPAGVDAIYVQAPKASAEVSIDGRTITTVAPGDEDGESIIEITLDEGWHRLDVALSSPYGAPRRFSAGTVRDGVRHPFDSTEVMTQRFRSWQVTAAGVLRRTRTIIDIWGLSYLGVIAAASLWRKVTNLFGPATDHERRRQVMAVFAAIAAIDALRAAWPWASRVMLLVAGDDTATYETFARDILFNGILMSGGKPLGMGEPFYYQAFYPYFLAATHAVFGEFMFGTVLVQRLLAAFAIVKLVEITIRFSTERVWMTALPVATAFIGWKFWPIAGQPLNESLYVPLLVAATAATIRLCDAPGAARAVWAGVLGGLAAITRSTALVAFVVTWPAVWFAMKGTLKRPAVMAILVASFLSVFSLVAIRNGIVAGVFAPASTSGGITMLGGNEPPAGLTISADRRPLYLRFGISDITATVIEYAITAPGPFMLNLGSKALFVLGFYEPYAPGWGYSPVYILVWTTAIAGLWLAVKHRQGPVWVVLIPLIISLTQFIAIVIVYPKGERLVVPIHTLLIPYAAVALWRLLPQRWSEVDGPAA